MIENNESTTLEKYLDSLHPQLIKSINKEKYMIDYDKFDLFHEITYDGDVVGFITLENDDLNTCMTINECYILPEWRGNNLFFKN